MKNSIAATEEGKIQQQEEPFLNCKKREKKLKQNAATLKTKKENAVRFYNCYDSKCCPRKIWRSQYIFKGSIVFPVRSSLH